MVRGTVIILTALLCNGAAGAAPSTFAAISHDVRSGRITPAAGAAYRLYTAFAPERLPDAYRGQGDVPHPVRHSSIELATLKRDFAALPKAVQDEFSFFAGRPSLTLERVRETTHFKIHYTFSGADRVTAAYLDSAAAAVEFVWNREVNELGYDAPPVDDAADPKYDIYLRNMDDAYADLYYGLTYMEDSNGAGYMELDNDYLEPDYATRGVTGLKVTMAHEFFHAVQYGYAGFSLYANAWWMEISSTWMEDAVYDGINDYLQYLQGSTGWFARPYLSLMTYDGWHEYGSCIFNHYLVEKYGIDIIRSVWEASRSAASAKEAVDNGLTAHGATFDAVYTGFISWLPSTGSRADTVNCFSEGHLYPLISQDTAISVIDLTQLNWTRIEDVAGRPLDEYGCSVIRISLLAVLPESSRTLRFVGQGNDQWGVAVAPFPDPAAGQGRVLAMNGGQVGEYSIPDTSAITDLYITAGLLDKNSAVSSFDYGFQTLRPAITTALHACYPNPFRPAVHDAVYFPFSMGTSATEISIYIYTSNGQLIRQLPVVPAMAYEYRSQNELTQLNAVWDGRNAAGKPVAAGSYYYRFHVADDDSKGLKMLSVIR